MEKKILKVSELIALLQTLSPDMEILASYKSEDTGEYRRSVHEPIVGVRTCQPKSVKPYALLVGDSDDELA